MTARYKAFIQRDPNWMTRTEESAEPIKLESVCLGVFPSKLDAQWACLERLHQDTDAVGYTIRAIKEAVPC
ncbi:hypothetical protein [Aquitalea sp. LB_tupeE]|uniref:hypothetical protein n=1 Tax=Aquitalea sp. LB_tupeE TaxID=2748078 RepID=UPI0015BECFB7|nr:hypothetical protein [Aquitalea sp. LB_tupeE]NWK77223.1 hypothetical protein [Aquitalea sp. LB_tupeE]